MERRILDWVCEHGYLVSTAQAIFYCGSILGGLVFGWLADNRGRIPALTLCTACALVGSIATASTTTFWTFALCRFVCGLAFDNLLNIPIIIVLEYVAIKKRTIVINGAFGFYFTVGSSLLPWMAYYLADWRKLCYYGAIPYVFCLMTPWILPESARWYLSNRKFDKVIEKLKKIARVNKVKPDPDFYETFRRNLDSSGTREETASLLDLFKTPRLGRITLILILFWALTVIAFDGHIYALNLLEGSVFVSFSLSSATELPAALSLTYLLDSWGRRFCGFITMFSTTVFSLVEAFLDSENGKWTMAMLSRFSLNMASNVVAQYAAELLPTPVRVQGVSMIHIWGTLAHAITPYVVDTAQWWTKLPLLIISVVSFAGALMALFLPETLGLAMPQTLQEGEDLGNGQKFWSLPCLERVGGIFGNKYTSITNRSDKRRKDSAAEC